MWPRPAATTPKPGGARPVDEIADQRRLVAEGQAVDDAGLSRLAGEQRAAQGIGLDGHVHDVLVLGERLETMLDRRDRVACAFDDDVDLRMPYQRLPIVADVRRSLRDGGIDRRRGAALGKPADAREIRQRGRRIEIGDGDDVHARRLRHLRQVHRAELAGADHADAQRPALRSALGQLGVKAQAGARAQPASAGCSAASGVPSRHGSATG